MNPKGGGALKGNPPRYLDSTLSVFNCNNKRIPPVDYYSSREERRDGRFLLAALRFGKRNEEKGKYGTPSWSGVTRVFIRSKSRPAIRLATRVYTLFPFASSSFFLFRRFHTCSPKLDVTFFLISTKWIILPIINLDSKNICWIITFKSTILRIEL